MITGCPGNTSAPANNVHFGMDSHGQKLAFQVLYTSAIYDILKEIVSLNITF